MTAEQPVGFIGLGIMGRPMARNLLRAGHRLVVHNRSREAVRDLESEGAAPAASAAEVAERCPTVLTMLPDSPDVEAVVRGPGGLLETLRSGSLVVDFSTISPRVARELAGAVQARGGTMLDAPVSGGDVGAREATLSIMVGGERAAFERALPLFHAVGKTITWVGEAGSGQVVKACNQIVVALTIEAVSEALVLGSKAGVDPKLIIQVLRGGLASNRVMEVRGGNFLEHRFEPGFKIRLHRKDLAIALDTARDHSVPLLMAPLVAQMFEMMTVQGKGDLDHSALLTALEEMASHRIGAQAAPDGDRDR